MRTSVMDIKRFDSDPDPNLIPRLESTTDVEPVYARKLLQQAKLGQLYLFSMYFTKLSTQFGSGSEETKARIRQNDTDILRSRSWITHTDDKQL